MSKPTRLALSKEDLAGVPQLDFGADVDTNPDLQAEADAIIAAAMAEIRRRSDVAGIVRRVQGSYGGGLRECSTPRNRYGIPLI